MEGALALGTEVEGTALPGTGSAQGVGVVLGRRATQLAGLQRLMLLQGAGSLLVFRKASGRRVAGSMNAIFL